MLKATTIGSDSNYIRFTIKSTTTTCMKATTVGANSVHIKFEVTTIVTCDNKVIVIGTECNPLTNNYIVINRNIRKVMTHFMYNIESNNDLI